MGQEIREEVDLLRKGANYQWPYREGTLNGPTSPPGEILGVEKSPIHEYGREDGNCVIGGYVYHGQQFARRSPGNTFADNVAVRLRPDRISGQLPWWEIRHRSERQR